MFANTIPNIEVPQESTENIDPSDTIICIDIVQVLNKNAQYQLIASRDTYHEARTDFETSQAMILLTLAHLTGFRFGDRRPPFEQRISTYLPIYMLYIMYRL